MIEVWISGRTRRAVVDDGQDVRLLRYGAPDDLEPCSPRQIDTLRDAGAAELRVLSAQPDPRALHAELARAVAVARARSGLETLLDPDFSLAVRHLAAEEVEALLGDAVVARATAARLEVGPLPVEPDVRGARRLCDAPRLQRVAALVEAYGDKLSVLRAAWDAWDELVRRADLDVAAQENAREWFATSGGFAALSDEVRQPTRHAFSRWLVSRAASAPAPMRTAARTLKRLPKLVRARLSSYDAPSVLAPAAIVAESGKRFHEHGPAAGEHVRMSTSDTAASSTGSDAVVTTLAQAEASARRVVGAWLRAGWAVAAWPGAAPAAFFGPLVDDLARAFGVRDYVREDVLASVPALAMGAVALGWVPLLGTVAEIPARTVLAEALIRYFKQRSPYPRDDEAAG